MKKRPKFFVRKFLCLKFSAFNGALLLTISVCVHDLAQLTISEFLLFSLIY